MGGTLADYPLDVVCTKQAISQMGPVRVWRQVRGEAQDDPHGLRPWQTGVSE
jgi:hypothetical protein